VNRQSLGGLTNVALPRIRGKALGPGRFRLTAVATDAAGNRSRPKRTEFRVLPKKKKKSGTR
jgi:hypothetical protein